MTKSTLWVLDRLTFRHILASSSQQNLADIKSTLARVPLLQSLTPPQLSRVAIAVKLVKFRVGDTIIRKGEKGDAFYVVKYGSVVCTDIGTGAVAISDVHLKEGELGFVIECLRY